MASASRTGDGAQGDPGIATRAPLVLPPRTELAGGGGDESPLALLAHGSVQFVGTATVLIRYGGLTILTDPNFLHRGDHVHLGYGLTSRRLTEPAFSIEELPPIDLVVLSHLHGDHFDHVVEKRLDHSLPIITTHQAARGLQRKGFVGARGLATWERQQVVKGPVTLSITSVPAQHAPGPLRAALPSTMGSVLEWSATGAAAVPGETRPPALRLYISGDTLLREQLKEIPRRFPDIDLGLLHLGGTRIMGLLLTFDARQGVEAIRWIQPKKVIPIHHSDYTVFKSLLSDFVREVDAAGFTDRVIYLGPGETHQFEVPPERWAAAGLTAAGAPGLPR